MNLEKQMEEAERRSKWKVVLESLTAAGVSNAQALRAWSDEDREQLKHEVEHAIDSLTFVREVLK